MISTEKLSKSFYGKFANENIDLEVKAGEVHAILGENGAGKTTLMKMLTGIYSPDSGKIFFKGEEIAGLDPGKAKDLGIGMIHQHILLIDNFTAWENIVLGNETGTPFMKKEIMLAKLEELKLQYGLTVDLNSFISDISGGQKQQVELLKLLYRDFDLLIFDEPTALLAPEEIEGLYRIMKELRNKNKSIIFITHKLKEIFAIADRVSTLCCGKILGTYEIADVSEKSLIAELFGEDLPQQQFTDKSTKDFSGELLIKELSIPGILNIGELCVKKGEIYGIAGIEGNGQKEFLDLLFDAVKGKKEIYFDNIRIDKGLRRMCALIPEDRSTEALLPAKCLWENFLFNTSNLSRTSEFGIIDKQKAAIISEEIIGQMNVKAGSSADRINDLSGGNQQKFILGRELYFEQNFIIAKNPTRGLDVKSERFVREYLKKQAAKGKAIILFSTELPELINISHRIGVLYRGSILTEFKKQDFSPEKIGKAMLGVLEDQNAR